MIKFGIMFPPLTITSSFRVAHRTLCFGRLLAFTKVHCLSEFNFGMMTHVEVSLIADFSDILTSRF
jgi:hypothetical protein